MNENSLTSIFSRLRDQYNSAVRWPYLGVILLLFIHLLTVGPFIELSRKKSLTEPKVERLSEVKSKIEGLGFKDMNEIVLTKLDQQLKEFVDNLISDFKRLNLTVQDLRRKAGTEKDLLPEKFKSMIPSDIREIHESILQANMLLEELKSKNNISKSESELAKEVENKLEKKLNSSNFRESVEFALIVEGGLSVVQKSADSPVQDDTAGFVEEQRPFQITDSNSLKKIKFTGRREELLKALKPFVEDTIIKRRYKELNEYWKKNLLPEIDEQFKEFTKDVNDLKSDFSGWDDEWDEQWEKEWEKELDKLDDAFGAIKTAAGELKFEQPNDIPFWWSSQEGKYEVKIEMKEKVTSELGEPEELKSLREQVSQLLEEEEKWGQKIDEDLSKFDKQFQDQKEKLASIAKPLQYLTLDLESVMKIFPLLLGLIFAGATVWTTLRLRELGLTIHLMIKEGADELLWDWYCEQVFFLLPKSSYNITKHHKSSLIRKSLFLCAMSWIWIGITAWRLDGISEISDERLVVVTCIGATVAALAQVYHYVVINSTLSLKSEQAASVATSSKK